MKRKADAIVSNSWMARARISSFFESTAESQPLLSASAFIAMSTNSPQDHPSSCRSLIGGAASCRVQLPSFHVMSGASTHLRMSSTTLRRSYQFRVVVSVMPLRAIPGLGKLTGSAQKLDASSGMLSKIPIVELP